jgi:hypothetical protein
MEKRAGHPRTRWSTSDQHTARAKRPTQKHLTKAEGRSAKGQGRSKASRARDVIRATAYKKAHPEATKKTRAKTWAKHGARYNFQRAERRARWKSIDPHGAADLFDNITTALDLQRAGFRSIDPNGLSIYETWEDPEEMETRMKLSGQIPCTPQERKKLQRKAAKKKGPK